MLFSNNIVTDFYFLFQQFECGILKFRYRLRVGKWIKIDVKVGKIC